MKGLDTSVYTLLNQVRDNTFRGGQVIRFDASTGGVALPMTTSRFTTFNQAQYDAIFAQLAQGNIRVTTADTPDETPGVIAGLQVVHVNEM